MPRLASIVAYAQALQSLDTRFFKAAAKGTTVPVEYHAELQDFKSKSQSIFHRNKIIFRYMDLRHKTDFYLNFESKSSSFKFLGLSDWVGHWPPPQSAGLLRNQALMLTEPPEHCEEGY